ncbi:unnamed protein product [Diabrotica balteata]|uniref:Uncharacterized protein n=1 Tax=Diabrotica balteata TaxID=107213 RepID=A0A9N9SRI9_DIABA|nr:unnamed protein product [Diabrotica balteata]
MISGGIDQAETKKIEKRNKRKEKSLQSKLSRNVELTTPPDLINVDILSSDSDDESMEEESSRACDCRGISNRAGAQLASPLLKNLNVTSPENQAAVIDKYKIFRERLKYRRSINSTRINEIIALYFDGRKDETIIKEIIRGKSIRKTIQEEHISLVEEPVSAYFGHATPDSESGKDIVSSILSYMSDNSIDNSNIKALGCVRDGTATNTGASQGAVLLFERALKHPVQVVICKLYLNELHLRKVFAALNCPTTGPTSLSGTIGKGLTNCQDFPVVNYDKIDSTFPEVDSTDLSTDQKYLWDICQAVVKGECSSELASRNPGNLSHARWLTLANIIFALFTIKCRPKIIHPSQHFFFIVQCTKFLDSELKTVAQFSLQRNASMAHPEHILL